jgi:triosephosphate isomerase
MTKLNKLILGNWKLNNGLEETKNYFIKFCELLNANPSNNLVGIAPTFCSIYPAILNNSANVEILAQNVSEKDDGAHTGEVSVSILKSFNVKYCLVGHSEVRTDLHESDELINTKVLKLINNNVNAVLCIGETLHDYDAGNTYNVIKSQITKGLKDVNSDQADLITVAYEPVWAIGTGKTATNDIVQNVCTDVRLILTELLGEEAAKKVYILYGGSVKETNAKDILSLNNVDGVLVGGASLVADKFYQIATAV